MGWFSANVTYEGTDEKTTQNQYGTRSPNVSGQYTEAFNRFRDSINPRGYNANQQQGVDYAENYLSSGGAAGRVAPVNTSLEGYRTNLNRYATATPNLLSPNAPRATAGVATAGTAVGHQIAGVDPVTAERVNASTGADYMGRYFDPYIEDVVDSSIADYDFDAGKAKADLVAGNASAFGNKRYGLAEGEFASNVVRGRNDLRSGLRSDAWKMAAGLGMQDSDRRLTGDIANQDAALRAGTSNADNLLRGRTFNAGALNDASIANANNQTSVSTTNATNNTNTSTTNANIQNTRDITDVGSRNTADTNAVNALVEQAGITQDIADNIFKADGIDLEVAQSLFTAGTISQAQLQAIMDAASAYNGYSYTQNSTGTRNTDTYGSEVGF